MVVREELLLGAMLVGSGVRLLQDPLEVWLLYTGGEHKDLC